LFCGSQSASIKFHFEEGAKLGLRAFITFILLLCVIGFVAPKADAGPVSIGVYVSAPFEFQNGILPVPIGFLTFVGARVWFGPFAGGFWVRLATNWLQATGYLFEANLRLVNDTDRSVWASTGLWLDLNPLEFAVFGQLEAALLRRGPFDFGLSLWARLFPQRVEFGMRASAYFNIDLF
jgi:hypothetical protein